MMDLLYLAGFILSFVILIGLAGIADFESSRLYSIIAPIIATVLIAYCLWFWFNKV